MSVNRGGAFAGGREGGGTGSAYVTFARPEDARACIAALDGTTLDGRPLRACFGTTKYCHAFLRGVACANGDCLFLHSEAPDRDSFTKEEMVARTAGQGSFAVAAGGSEAAQDDVDAATPKARSSGTNGSASNGSANGGNAAHQRSAPRRGQGAAAAAGLPVPLMAVQMAQQLGLGNNNGGHGGGFAGASFPPLPQAQAAPHVSSYDQTTTQREEVQWAAAAEHDEQQRRLERAMQPSAGGAHLQAAQGGGVRAALAAAQAAQQARQQVGPPALLQAYSSYGYEQPRQQEQEHAGTAAAAPYGGFGEGSEEGQCALAQSRYRFAKDAAEDAAAALGRLWPPGPRAGAGTGAGQGGSGGQLQAHREVYEAAAAAELEARRALQPPSIGVPGGQPGGRGRGRAGAQAGQPGGQQGGPSFGVAAAVPPPGGQPREGRRHRRGGQRSGNARQALG